MAVDDLCGEDGFGLDVGQDLPRSRRAPPRWRLTII